MTIYTVINVIARDAEARECLAMAGSGFIEGAFESFESAQRYADWLNQNIANPRENRYFVYKTNLHK